MSIYFRIFVPPLCLFELILSYMYAISPAKITPTLQLKTVLQLEPLEYMMCLRALGGILKLRGPTVGNFLENVFKRTCM